MVDGGEFIELAEWKTVSGIIQKVCQPVLKFKKLVVVVAVAVVVVGAAAAAAAVRV